MIPVDLAEVLESLADPRMRHAAVVHLPVAAGVLGLPLVTAWLLTRGRSSALRGCIVVLYGSTVLAALVAADSGDAARALAGGAGVEALAVVAEHAAWARWVWATALVPVLGALAWRSSRCRRWSRLVVGAGALACAAHTGLVGHLGGTAVYAHGVGMPRALAGDLDGPANRAAAAGGSLAAHAATSSVDQSTAETPVTFPRDVRPILETSCTGCHAPPAPASGLDLTSLDALLRGGRRGPAVVPGDAEDSRLWRAAAWTDDELRMPPEGDRLTEARLDTLRRWIEDGAPAE